ncbi:FG-GAP repeat-containing protein [Sulfitobacter noctilucae]|uniref:hypothetical protein n=1 Tax=Sulfitobacter noctilucae TaxID=1342302 RepID=UPI000468703C|nr:hypothetical protein [Sulfitobacter noctilucae]KIN61560.1 FG-GAP repeat-containing protein [Sulfitobacter noctilucae]
MRRALAAALFWLAAGPLSAAPQIASAVYAEPTTRYPHGVLGDKEEWGALTIVVRDPAIPSFEKTYQLRLPEARVFEDLSPRLTDLDDVPGPEIIAVESHQDKGARLVVFGLDGAGAPVERAATEYIGTRFRWLAPVGIADFDGDGVQDIAIVDRPHLARRLVMLRYGTGRLEEHELPFKLTNHRIGDDFISGGMRDCGQGPQMILLTPDWIRIVEVSWQDGGYHSRDIGPNTSRQAVQSAVACR